MEPEKEIPDREVQKIIPNIATKWKDIGIELGVRNLNNYEKNPNLTEEKFKRMLELWLDANPEPIAKLCDDFHRALQDLNLNLAAKQFKEKYPKFI